MAEQQQDTERQQQSPLHTERGTTTIQDGVVSKVVGIAAQEVDGVRMGGSTSQTADNLLGSITGGGSGGGLSRGVSVEVGEVEAAADLTMTVEYGRSIPQTSEAVRRNVAKRVENLLGLQVTEVNITVSDVFFPQEQEEQQEQQG
jgi:uncharacterized alkaline shock family protein YloU